MNQGDIAAVSVLTSSGTPKHRPVLLLKQLPAYGDWLVCGISGKLHQEVKGFDLVILDTDPQFQATGLKKSSVVRLGYLSTIPNRSFPGAIGSVDSVTLGKLLRRLSDHLLQ